MPRKGMRGYPLPTICRGYDPYYLTRYPRLGVQGRSRQMAKIPTNHYAFDATISVYRGNHHCGMVFCPIADGGRSDYLASPWTDAVAQRTFSEEAEAVSYLVREA